MNMELVFATGNAHKISEVVALLPAGIRLKSLTDIGCPTDLPETTPTIMGNALQKARYVYDNFGVNCFAEDTGMEVDALNGEPGVRSARYAGEDKQPQDNTRLVLEKMNGMADRRARFRTVIALILNGETHTFEGVAEGRIAESPTGSGGFGYDPIFIPEGETRSFAQMPAAEKNAISHRGKAVAQLLAFLSKL
jgi:XTP/dITP diphosphohydrolase